MERRKRCFDSKLKTRTSLDLWRRNYESRSKCFRQYFHIDRVVVDFTPRSVQLDGQHVLVWRTAVVLGLSTAVDRPSVRLRSSLRFYSTTDIAAYRGGYSTTRVLFASTGRTLGRTGDQCFYPLENTRKTVEKPVVYSHRSFDRNANTGRISRRCCRVVWIRK